MLTFLGSDFDWVSGKKERAPSLQTSQQSEQMSSFSTDLRTLLNINLFSVIIQIGITVCNIF